MFLHVLYILKELREKDILITCIDIKGVDCLTPYALSLNF